MKKDGKYSEILYNLADTYRKIEKFNESRPLYLESLSIIEKEYGMKHAEVAEVCNALGMQLKKEGHPSSILSTLFFMICFFSGQYEEAKSYYNRALMIVTELFGSSHPKNGIYLVNLGDIYRKQGDYENAENSYAKAIPILEESLGKDNVEVADALNRLGFFLLLLSSSNKQLIKSFFPVLVKDW